MTERVEIQNASTEEDIPSPQQFGNWVERVLEQQHKRGSVVIRLVDAQESQSLNYLYRKKNRPTNILSFPFETPDYVDDNHLGDLVICIELVKQEARQQGKTELAHWAHLVIHGMLHLLGYDHETDKEAILMEELEIALLNGLHIANPYEDKN